MKVLYGIQGTGNGHITRAKALVHELKAVGIDVECIFSGRKQDDYFDMGIFGDNSRYFSGLSLVTKNGKLHTFETLKKNRFYRFAKDIKQLNVDNYDVILSDFEPISAWSAKLKGKPSIGISHQCAFLYNVPKAQGHYFSKKIMRYFAPTDINIGLHWHHFNQPILPPIIGAHVHKTAIANKILVYMGFEELDKIVHFLLPHTQYRFIVYAKVPRIRKIGHITIKPLSAEFHTDLQDAAGVISNAGFELASECLSLGKKLLVKPLLGQYEQLSNTAALKTLGRAHIMESLEQSKLTQWLNSPAEEPIHYPNTAQHIAQWLKSGDWKNTNDLTISLWKDTEKKIQLQ